MRTPTLDEVVFNLCLRVPSNKNIRRRYIGASHLASNLFEALLDTYPMSDFEAGERLHAQCLKTLKAIQRLILESGRKDDLIRYRSALDRGDLPEVEAIEASVAV